jgi:single-strand DNA-binding protein
MSATVILTGNLGGDPESRTTKSGMMVAEFSVAISNGKDKDATWYRVSCFGKMHDDVMQKFHKGNRVMVIGTLKVNIVNDKTYLNVVATQWPELLSKPTDGDEEYGF